MSANHEKSIQQLLRQAMPPVNAELEPEHDLWPAVRQRLNANAEAHSAAQMPSKWIWFDWALAAGLAVMTVSFPASIPLLLYYL